MCLVRRLLHTTLLAAIVVCTLASGVMAAPVTLDFMIFGDATAAEIEREVLDAFEAKNPNIKVNLLVSTWGEYKDKLTAMIIGGTAPDIALIDGYWYHEFVQKGLIIDVDNYVKRDNYQLSDTNPVFLQEMIIGGKLYSVANSRGASVIYYYNTDKLAEVGVPDPHDTTWNWDSFSYMLKKLTMDKNGDGVIDYGGIQRQIDRWWQPFVYGNGGDWIDGEAGTSSWEDPKTVEALQFLADLWVKDRVFNGWWNQGTAASYLMWGTSVGANQKTVKHGWDIIAPPAGPVQQMSYVKGNMVAILASSPHKEEAWQLMKFLGGEEAQYMYGSKGLFFPVHRRAAIRVINESRGKAPEHFMDILDMRARPLPLCAEYTQIDTMYRAEMGPLWSGAEPASTTAKRLKDLTDALFAESRGKRTQ